MRILCVIDNLGSGGAQRQMVELAVGFKENRNHVEFLTYHPESFFYQNLENVGIPITCISETSYLKRLLRMRQFIKGGNYNVVLSFLESASLICEITGLPYRKWKLIVGERNADPNILKSFKLRVYRWFHLFSDYVISNSEANIRFVRKVNPFLRESKCKVIYNSLDFGRWHANKGHKFRKGGKLNMVVASSHIYRKNLIGLVKALMLLSDEEKDRINIVWYGDRVTEPYFDVSIVESRELIREHHLDYILSLKAASQNITKIIQESDVVGLFSLYEGLPNAIIEGMACGKPVICSEVSDIPKFLSYDKNLMFQPEDCVSIKNALRYVINLTEEQLNSIGQTNEILAKENFNKEIIVKKYLDLIT